MNAEHYWQVTTDAKSSPSARGRPLLFGENNWDDLRDEYDRLAPASHYAWTFDELQTRVWFDWSAAPDAVRNADPPQQVFRLTSGRQVSFNGDPNKLIRDYLRTGNDPWRVDPPIGQNGRPSPPDGR